MEVMTDYQLKVILQLVIDKLENCKSEEDYRKAIEEIKQIKDNK